MRTRQLGNTDLHLTTIGFGAWAIGGGNWAYGWGPQDDTKSINAIHRALELGINWIDTAPIYGIGHSEEIVGKAIKGKRDEVIIATKCGLLADKNRIPYGKLTRDSVRQEVEDSLRRLDIDVIDLYQIHWPNPPQQIEEGWEAVSELIKDGKIRYGGVSNFNVTHMERIKSIHPVASLQPPYSMLERGIEKEILPYCGENNIGVVAYSPLRNGLLTGKMTPERIAKLPDEDWRKTKNPDFKEPALSKNLKIVAKLTNIAKQYDKTPAQLAIAWVLRRDEVTSAIVGARRPDQIEETAVAGDWILPPEVIDEIEHLLK